MDLEGEGFVVALRVCQIVWFIDVVAPRAHEVDSGDHTQAARLLNVASERTGTVREVKIQMRGNDHHVGPLSAVVREERYAGLESEAAKALGSAQIAVCDDQV